MSKTNIADFATSAQEDAEKTVQDGMPQVLQMITKNRKSGRDILDLRIGNLRDTLDLIRKELDDEGLMVTKTLKGKVVFSLENTLRDIQHGLDACLTSMEANDSLTDMLIHDLGGIVQQINETQKAMFTSNSHVQVLLEVLKDKNIIDDSEMKEMWEKIVAIKRKEMEEAATQE